MVVNPFALRATQTYVCNAGKPPSAFPQDRLHIDFSGEVSIGRQLASVVDGLLEPLVEDRLTAADALDILSEESQTSNNDTAVVRSRQVLPGKLIQTCCI